MGKTGSLFSSDNFMDERLDPFTAYAFMVEIDGIEVFGFKEVSGLSNNTDIYEYQEGGENQFTHKLIGQTTFSNLLLKHGVVLDEEIYNWRKLVIDGKIHQALRDGTITLVGEGTSKDRSWNFYKAWPCKWEVNTLSGTSNELVIETLELALERIERSKS